VGRIFFRNFPGAAVFRLPRSPCYAETHVTPRAPIESKKTKRREENIMGILEEAAGAFAAVEGAKKLDPNAGILTEGIAAVAGFEGTEAITNFIDKKKEESEPQQG
jgi:hypothetical protein